MTDPLCACGCGKPCPDGYATTACVDRARRQLAEIADLAPIARDIARGQIRRGGGGGGSTNPPESRPPISIEDTEALGAVQNWITARVFEISSIRGTGALTSRPSGHTHPDPLTRACWALHGQMEWVRHRAEIFDQPLADILTGIDNSTRTIRGIVNGSVGSKFLGICGGELGNLEWDTPSGRCEGDVRGRPGAKTGRCRDCGAEYDQDERLTALAKLTTDKAFRAGHIAHAHGIAVDTIRSWARRGRLRSWWDAGDDEGLREWTEPEGTEAEIAAELKARGPRLHVVADVLALRDADRRKRQERAAREAAEMGA